MQRYFVNEKENNIFTLSKDDSYHIIKVMRMNIHDKIEIIYNEELYISEIIDNTNLIKAKIIEKIIENNELSNKVILVQSLVKEQKMDFILQKCTELGVYKIIPYISDRSLIKVKNKDIKKVERWNKITKEASEQSKRKIIPEVTNIINLKELINIDADIKMICTVNEKTVNIKKIINKLNEDDKVLIIIGPEGGFTNAEEQLLIDNGFISVSLGNSVLRTETAGLFVLSCLRYVSMG